MYACFVYEDCNAGWDVDAAGARGTCNGEGGHAQVHVVLRCDLGDPIKLVNPHAHLGAPQRFCDAVSIENQVQGPILLPNILLWKHLHLWVVIACPGGGPAYCGWTTRAARRSPQFRAHTWHAAASTAAPLLASCPRAPPHAPPVNPVMGERQALLPSARGPPRMTSHPTQPVAGLAMESPHAGYNGEI